MNEEAVYGLTTSLYQAALMLYRGTDTHTVLSMYKAVHMDT
ncbi:hypothetical protein APHNP_1209 [Anaplasma phagocytophilum str. ApNP]|uniref:Uncharacterized protein n=2 Tax=Anaplasma phagocytophilum TaxID=948 RepID=A0A0F3NHA3_ANAPH|nr:hypothetical protein APHMUC_1388 [Anaplasma phagocytophilum str. ApMUC09]KJV67146.1 hypothetical protein APHNP_1209 [Anaplasma phagocytophilum str. ApNP]